MNNSRKKIFKFVEKQTDMPPIAFADLVHIEISGPNHIELDGIRKILEYRQDKIRIRFKHGTVCFSGEDIFLRNYSQNNAIIEGNVKQIEFE